MASRFGPAALKQGNKIYIQLIKNELNQENFMHPYAVCCNGCVARTKK